MSVNPLGVEGKQTGEEHREQGWTNETDARQVWRGNLAGEEDKKTAGKQ